jgi:hypothetical protein
MASLASSKSASSAESTPYFSAYPQLSAGSSASSCYAIISKSVSLGEGFSLPSIMEKRLLSSPVAMNLEKLIDPLSKISKEFKEQLNALNSTKSSAAPIALVLE